MSMKIIQSQQLGTQTKLDRFIMSDSWGRCQRRDFVDEAIRQNRVDEEGMHPCGESRAVVIGKRSDRLQIFMNLQIAIAVSKT